MEDRQIGGIEGLRSTVRFLSVPDEFRNFLGPYIKKGKREAICSRRIS